MLIREMKEINIAKRSSIKAIFYASGLLHRKSMVYPLRIRGEIPKIALKLKVTTLHLLWKM